MLLLKAGRFYRRLKHSTFIKILTIIIIFVLLCSLSSSYLNSKSDNDISDKPTVVVVLDSEIKLETFLLAQSTLACYCKIYGYRLIKIIMNKSPEMQKLCPQKHIWFQRICVPMRILQLNPDIKYLFFLDADIGVINPNHRLEDNINPKYDLSFYERIFNYDIMTGSIIMKNTKFAIKFIQDWLELEDLFTREYGGNDQAAIHQMFLNRFYQSHPRKEKCEKIWISSDNKTMDGHTNFVACARSIMDDKMEFDNIIIYPKGSHKAWVRDVWITKSQWAPRDFMFHDMDVHRITNDPGRLKDLQTFPNPFISDAIFHSTLCTKEDGLNCWKYNSTLIKTDEFIDEKIEKKAAEVKKKYLEFIETL